MKTAIERKNAKKVVSLLKDNPKLTVREIAIQVGIFYNVSSFLVENLRKEGYIDSAPDIKTGISLIHSEQSGILRRAFRTGSIMNTELIQLTKKLGGDLNMLRRDVQKLLKSKAIVKEKEGNHVVFKTAYDAA